jgi:hypothetical protein
MRWRSFGQLPRWVRQLAYTSLNKQRWQQAARGRRRSELPWQPPVWHLRAMLVAAACIGVASVPVAYWTDTSLWATVPTSIALGAWWRTQGTPGPR